MNDYQTNTVDGAAGFERVYGDYQDNTPTRSDFADELDYDDQEDAE